MDEMTKARNCWVIADHETRQARLSLLEKIAADPKHDICDEVALAWAKHFESQRANS